MRLFFIAVGGAHCRFSRVKHRSLGRGNGLRYAETMVMTTPDTLSLIGNTPLVRLAGPSEESGCEIYGKCEPDPDAVRDEIKTRYEARLKRIFA